MPGLAERWEVARSRALALPPAQGRASSTTARPSPPTTWCSPPSGMRSPGSQIKRAHPGRRAGGEGRRPHRRLRPGLAQSRSCTAEWETWLIFSKTWAEANGADAGAGGVGHLAQPLRAQGQRHRSVHDRQPRAGREDRVQGATRTGGARPEHNLGEVVFQTINVRRDARRRAAVGRHRPDGPGAGAGHRAHPGRARSPPCWSKPELRTIFLNHGRASATSCSIPTSRARTPSRTRACARPSTRRSTSRRSRRKIMRGMSAPTRADDRAAAVLARRASSSAGPMTAAAAKRLMAEAGYPRASSSAMDCPNDRYVNDEEICQAVAGHARPHRRQDRRSTPCPRPSTSRRRGRSEVRLLLQSARLVAELARQLRRARQQRRAAATRTARAGPSTSAAEAGARWLDRADEFSQYRACVW